MRRDDDRGPLRAQPLQQVRSARPCGRDPCRASARPGRARRGARRAARSRSRAAGARRRRCRAGDGRRAARDRRPRARRAAARRRHGRAARSRPGSGARARPCRRAPSRAWARAARRRAAEASTSPPRCAPSARPAPRPRPPGRSPAGPRHRPCARTTRGRAATRAALQDTVRRHASLAPPPAARTVPGSVSCTEGAAGVLDGDGQRARGRPGRTAARPGSGAPGACSPAQARKVAGSASHATAPSRSATTRSAAARQRSRRCSASTTAVPHSSLSRRSTPSSSSPATGSSWDVGSSSSATAGRPASAAPSATRCSSPPDSSCVERSSSCAMPSASAGLLHAARDSGRREPLVLEREGELAADRVHHDLRLGVLEQRAGHRGQRRRLVGACVEAAGRHAARELATVEVRHQPARGAQQRRLARAGAAREHHELARRDLEVDAAQRGRADARVGVGDALERERRAHRPIPRRSANGSRTHATSSAARVSTAPSTGARKDG